jgi:AraC family transcriptional regulator
MSSEIQGATCPSELAKLLPSRPLLQVGEECRKTAVIQYYRHPSGRVSTPPLRDHLLVVNLAGQVLIEDTRSLGRYARRWAGAGQMSLTPAGEAGARELKGRAEVLLVHLSTNLVRQTAIELGFDEQDAILVDRLAIADEVIDHLGRLLLNAAQDSMPGGSVMLDSLVRVLVVHLLRKHSVASPEPARAPFPGNMTRLQRVIDYMSMHLDERLAMPRLAELSELSPTQFARTFRAATGKTPHGYLLELRIGRARELLETTDLAVIEVGLRCGFEQPSHFATMFRQIVGLSPRAWRIARRA